MLATQLYIFVYPLVHHVGILGPLERSCRNHFSSGINSISRHFPRMFLNALDKLVLEHKGTSSENDIKSD